MIQESNKLIADFMGKEYYSGKQSWSDFWDQTPHVYQLRYHTSWDWLIPVVEKIETLKTPLNGYYAVYISSNGCTIQDTNLNLNKAIGYFDQCYTLTKIEATYSAIINFIKYYNENSNK